MANYNTLFNKAEKVITGCKGKKRIQFIETKIRGWLYGYVYRACETYCVVTTSKGKIYLPSMREIEKCWLINFKRKI